MNEEKMYEDEISLAELFYIIWKRRVLVIILFITSVLIALVYSLLAPQKFMRLRL